MANWRQHNICKSVTVTITALKKKRKNEKKKKKKKKSQPHFFHCFLQLTVTGNMSTTLRMSIARKLGAADTPIPRASTKPTDIVIVHFLP